MRADETDLLPRVLAFHWFCFSLSSRQSSTSTSSKNIYQISRPVINTGSHGVVVDIQR